MNASNPPAGYANPHVLSRPTAIAVFAVFAAAYFCSALVRAITATLAPVLTAEFGLQSRDLGLLAGGYFLGFALMQLPLGTWLDRYGPKRVIVCFLALAVAGCLAFSMAQNFAQLLAARVLVGMGVSACLMAPMTGYRRWFDAATLLRANSWMLMTGSLGALASTLPVQWLMPLTGWRPLFWILAALLALALAAIALQVPAWKLEPASAADDKNGLAVAPGYSAVWRNAYFRRMLPIAFFNYGGLLSVQTLWAGPWMVKVAGYTPLQSATGLFYINASMLLAFWGWGLVSPRLVRGRWDANRLLAWGVPLSLVALAVNIALGPNAGWQFWAVYCVAATVLGLAQPAVAMVFDTRLAGRALSAYNLVIFSGIFVVQWGIGLLIDGFAGALGWSTVASFQGAMGVVLMCSVGAYAVFLQGHLAGRNHNQSQ